MRCETENSTSSHSSRTTDDGESVVVRFANSSKEASSSQVDKSGRKTGFDYFCDNQASDLAEAAAEEVEDQEFDEELFVEEDDVDLDDLDFDDEDEEEEEDLDI